MSNQIIANDKAGKYGFPWPEGILPIHQELFAYSVTRGNYAKRWEEKNLHPIGRCLGDYQFREPVEHLINASRLMWPTDVEIQVRQYVNRPLLRIWEEWCSSDDIGIAGNASCSKTFGIAGALTLDWASVPTCTLSFVASTSLGGSEDRIWGTVAKLFRRMAYPIGHLIDHRKIIVFEDPSKDDERDYTNAIKALAFPSGDEGRKAVDTTRGRKAARIRVVVDELAEMESYVNNVRVNLRANDDVIYVGLANPAPDENPHKELCEPADPRGYDSITVSSRKWKTRTGTAIFIHGDDSPNFEAPPEEPVPFPYLLTRRKKDDILKSCYGDANSMEYWRNVIGFWPLDSIESSIISRAAIKNADIGFEPAWTNELKTRIAFLDCAWTSGGDRNEVSYGFIGELRESRKKVLMYQGTRGYAVSAGTVFEESLAQKVIPDLKSYGVAPSSFGMDVSGDGGKVLSAFIKEWQKTNRSGNEIIPITSSGSPTDKLVSSADKRKRSEVYDRRITEYWFQVFHAITNRCVFGIDMLEHKEMLNELCARRYTFKGKKMSVEIKKEMKKRIGRSPDKADSFVGLYLMAQRMGVEIIVDDNVSNHFEEEDDHSQVEFGTYGGECRDEDGF